MRLICGEALEAMRAMPDGSVSCVVTDPPYGRNQEWHHGRKGQSRAYRVENDDSLEAADAVRRWCAARMIPLVMFMSPDKQLPGPWQQLLVWDKGGAVGGGGDVRRTLKRTWELIGVEGAWLHGPRGNSVLRHAVTPASFVHHRCQKPLKLMRELVASFVPPGGVCLDPFMGSGTTGVACAMEGRDFVGVEMQADYFAVAQRRIAEAAALAGAAP